MTTAALLPRADWRALVRTASAPYRRTSRFASMFARGKLGLDPVFRHLLQSGLIAPHARVLDIGCGQGLLASLLRSCDAFERSGRWPHDGPVAPAAARVTGIELAARDVRFARAALGDGAEFICGDMRTTPFPDVDAVVILDALHYVDRADQDAVLERVRHALAPGGTLLMRVGDASARRRLAATQWLDRFGSVVRGHAVAAHCVRTLPEWRARLEALGFVVSSQPMSRGTPFANVLLVARLQRPR